MVVFFNETATTEIYTLSLHDALPILELPVVDHGSRVEHLLDQPVVAGGVAEGTGGAGGRPAAPDLRDRKSTRLNSSHANISYAVFCLKKKAVEVSGRI